MRVIMITGDHPRTAAAHRGRPRHRRLPAHRCSPACRSTQLDERRMRSAAVRQTSVFARVAPEHKLRIVRRAARRTAIVWR
jgi:Ca2+-transporting ATPase